MHVALHNFIRDNKMADELFDKCDEDDEYMLFHHVIELVDWKMRREP
jgi:hypothetical protein